MRERGRRGKQGGTGKREEGYGDRRVVQARKGRESEDE